MKWADVERMITLVALEFDCFSVGDLQLAELGRLSFMPPWMATVITSIHPWEKGVQALALARALQAATKIAKRLAEAKSELQHCNEFL